MQMRYSVIGLGKLGASMAAAIASRGFPVIGVDVDQFAVDLLNRGHAPVRETGLEELIAGNRQRLRATRSQREAVANSDVSFVIVPTPSDSRGAFSLEYAAAAFGEIGKALRDKRDRHLVVLTSTVLPGATRFGLLPALERASGKTCGLDFGLCYSPEFIALGSVIHDFLHPDFTLVGQFDESSGALLERCYAKILLNQAPCRRMSLENAELAKIALNTYVTTKITFANLLADLCELIPGGDVDAVAEALGSDRRIGRRYLSGGLGYGGPCFPRDNQALAFLARALGTTAELAEVTDRSNRARVGRTVNRLRRILRPGSNVAVLGLAYKPGSPVIEQSQGMMLATMLAHEGARVMAYDPLANLEASREFRDHAVGIGSLQQCLRRCEVVLIATPDPCFQKLTARDFTASPPVTVVDFWRILERELRGKPNIRYVAAGRGGDAAETVARLRALWSEPVPDIVPAEEHAALRSCSSSSQPPSAAPAGANP